MIIILLFFLLTRPTVSMMIDCSRCITAAIKLWHTSKLQIVRVNNGLVRPQLLLLPLTIVDARQLWITLVVAVTTGTTTSSSTSWENEIVEFILVISDFHGINGRRSLHAWTFLCSLLYDMSHHHHLVVALLLILVVVLVLGRCNVELLRVLLLLLLLLAVGLEIFQFEERLIMLIVEIKAFLLQSIFKLSFWTHQHEILIIIVVTLGTISMFAHESLIMVVASMSSRGLIELKQFLTISLVHHVIMEGGAVLTESSISQGFFELMHLLIIFCGTLDNATFIVWSSQDTWITFFFLFVIAPNSGVMSLLQGMINRHLFILLIIFFISCLLSCTSWCGRSQRHILYLLFLLLTHANCTYSDLCGHRLSCWRFNVKLNSGRTSRIRVNATAALRMRGQLAIHYREDSLRLFY